MVFMHRNIRPRICEGNTRAWLFVKNSPAHNSGMEKTVYSERLLMAMETRGMTQYALELKSGVPQPTIQRILSGKTRNPKADTLQSLATALGIASLMVDIPEIIDENRHFLVSADVRYDKYHEVEIEPDNAEFASIRRVLLKPSAGITGFSIDVEPEDGKPIFFRRDYLAAKGWDAAHLIAQRICGDSMEPGLFDDDLVVINTADKKPREGYVFVINYEGELLVKRLARNAGEWLLRSDNPDKRRYPDKVLDGHAIVIGRVVYRQSENI